MPRFRTCIACNTRIPDGSRCEACKPARQKNGWAWTQTVQGVLERDGRQCTECPNTTGLEVHHKIPLRHGGTDDSSNLVTLCKRCHLSQD